MRDAKTIAIAPATYIVLVGLFLWMTVPSGIRGLLSVPDFTAALLVIMGIGVGVIAALPRVRSYVLNGRMPRANAIVIVVFLVLIGILQVPKLLLLSRDGTSDLAFEIIDKLVLLALLATLSLQLLMAVVKAVPKN